MNNKQSNNKNIYSFISSFISFRDENIFTKINIIKPKTPTRAKRKTIRKDLRTVLNKQAAQGSPKSFTSALSLLVGIGDWESISKVEALFR